MTLSPRCGLHPLPSPDPLSLPLYPTLPASYPPSLSLSPFTLTLSLHPHPLLPPTRPLPTCISQPFHLFTPLSPAPPPSAPTGIGKEFSWVDCWKDGTRSQKSQTQSTCAGHRGFPLGSMEWSLFGTLSVTAMQGLLEASSRVFLFGGGAQLPKDPALGFVPRIVGRHPVSILSSSHT